MPTEFVAQDGAVIRRSTPIAVTGCPQAKAKAARLARAARRVEGRGYRTRPSRS
jgi:hypothetical protein